MLSHEKILLQLNKYKLQKLLFVAQLYRYRNIRYQKLKEKNELSYKLLSKIHGTMDYELNKIEINTFLLKRFPEMAKLIK